jgi:MFS family permease
MTTGTLSSSVPAASAQESGPLPGARLALAVLLAINFFNFIDRQVLAAVVHPMTQYFFPEAEKGADEFVEAKMGLLQFAFMFSYLILAPAFGWLADRVSRWWLIGAAVVVWSLASGASGLAPTFLLLFLTRCFVGVGEAAYGPAAPTIISDLYPVKVRGSVLAWFYAAIPVGSALGYALGGLTTTIWGDDRWNLAFYMVVPPGLLLGVWCFFMPEPPRGQADLAAGEPRRTARLKDYVTLLRTPSYVLDCLGMTALTFALGGIAFWMPRYIVHDRGEPDLGTVNLIFGGIVVVSGLGATLLGGLAGDKLRGRFPGSYFLVSGVSMLLAFVMIPLALWTPFRPFPWAWIFIFLACFFLFFNTGPTNTILANVTHPAVRASAFALNIFIIHLFGDAVSPSIIGVITHYTSMNTAFLVVSGMVLVGGLLWLWGIRFLERDTLLAPTRLGPLN